MNIPSRDPPAKSSRGLKAAFSRIDEITIWSWYCARRELGSTKTLAKKLGCSHKKIDDVLRRMRERENEEARRIGRLNERRTIREGNYNRSDRSARG